MLENDEAEHRLGPGPVFIVDDVDGFRSQQQELDWLLEPCDVPVGRYAAYRESSSSTIRLLDLSCNLGERRTMFSHSESAEVRVDRKSPYTGGGESGWTE